MTIDLTLDPELEPDTGPDDPDDSDEPAHPWMVATRQHSATAGVSVTGEGLLVFVSESSEGHTGTMARLYPDGAVDVQCVGAPQAILVSPQVDPVLVPALPGMPEHLTMGQDDVLVLCSAGVLEHLPLGLGFVVPRVEGDFDADLLLAEMLTYGKVGAAAVVRRLPN